ncbi:MAG: M20/M25/M40 family metallo-hydrolase [Clostridia bacterium]|nr:M20/M25/M40 family metallo-hydrolase [Clostridia bacterium]
MINTKELIGQLCNIMSVTGYEHRGAQELTELISPYFDHVYEAVGGTYVAVKYCGRDAAPRLMLDAHFDEIGMIVTDILPGGYLSFSHMGGLDRRIMPASEVYIYGREKIYGVICSKPPHLQKPGESKKLPALDEMLIDTGYSEDELRKIVSIGDGIGFYESTAELLGNRICGRSMDNKACCAAAIIAAANVEREKMACDLYVTLSSREEESLAGGCVTAAYDIRPDIAIVTDVTFSRFPGVDDYESAKMGEGASVSLSAVTDRKLTNRLIYLAENAGFKLQTTVDAENTGTNATALTLCGDGIPCAVVSVPLSCMHTYNEIIDTSDVEAAAKLFMLAVCDEDIFREEY